MDLRSCCLVIITGEKKVLWCEFDVVYSWNSTHASFQRNGLVREWLFIYTCTLEGLRGDACLFDSCMLVTALPGRIPKAQRPWPVTTTGSTSHSYPFLYIPSHSHDTLLSLWRRRGSASPTSQALSHKTSFPTIIFHFKYPKNQTNLYLLLLSFLFKS